MFDAIRQMLRPGSGQALPSIPDGRRVYAIGDVHGRLDLLTALREAIGFDDAARDFAETSFILLGDLIDRGPDSAGVVAFTRDWRETDDVRVLCGNHEEMFLASLESTAIFRHFSRYGGRETALSYGVPEDRFDAAPTDEARKLMIDAIPQQDVEFLAGLEDYAVIGDYLFVHAGIRPNRRLDAQSQEDLRWIREPFLSSHADHGHFVVHGHTISHDAEVRANRIGIDTGAYTTGRLTALGLHGSERWLIEAQTTQSGIETALKAIESA